jgi:hypothetical protein
MLNVTRSTITVQPNTDDPNHLAYDGVVQQVPLEAMDALTNRLQPQNWLSPSLISWSEWEPTLVGET